MSSSEKPSKRIFRTGFMTEIDQFLRNFDKDHAPSTSRIKEVEKHRKIFEKRDNPIDESPDFIL